MAYVGGLRARLVKESLFQMVNNALEDLGWFDAGRQHSPIQFLDKEVANDDEVPLNTLSLADGDIVASALEMGSTLSEHSWAFYLDFFGESDVLSLDVSRDLKDILEGRMPSIGRVAPRFTVYDYTMATPPEIFVCDISGVSLDRAQNFPKQWQKYWRSVSFVVNDEYADEDDS